MKLKILFILFLVNINICFSQNNSTTNFNIYELQNLSPIGWSTDGVLAFMSIGSFNDELHQCGVRIIGIENGREIFRSWNVSGRINTPEYWIDFKKNWDNVENWIIKILKDYNMILQNIKFESLEGLKENYGYSIIIEDIEYVQRKVILINNKNERINIRNFNSSFSELKIIGAYKNPNKNEFLFIFEYNNGNEGFFGYNFDE
jgi:hypothetical protein